MLLGDLRKLNTADRAWFQEKIGWFKKLRATTRISESFFPLGSWQQTTPAAWDGFARLARSGNGVISLFRNKSKVTDAAVRLPLIPAGTYKVRSVITEKEFSTSDSDWKRGVRVTFPADHSVEVLEINLVKS